MKWSIFCTLQGIRIVNSAFHQEVINFVLFPTVFLSFSSVIFESSFVFVFLSHCEFCAQVFTCPSISISVHVVCLSVCGCDGETGFTLHRSTPLPLSVLVSN